MISILMMFNILFPLDLVNYTVEQHVPISSPGTPCHVNNRHASVKPGKQLTKIYKKARTQSNSDKTTSMTNANIYSKSDSYLLLGHIIKDQAEPSNNTNDPAIDNADCNITNVCTIDISVTAILKIDEGYMKSGPNGGSDLISTYCRNGSDTSNLLNVVGMIVPHNFELSVPQRETNRIHTDSSLGKATASSYSNYTLCERLAKASEYFLCIRKCQKLTCEHLNKLPNRLAVNSTTSKHVQAQNKPSCSGDCTVFVDHMRGDFVTNEHLTVIYHNPNDLLQAHLLRSAVARTTDCSNSNYDFSGSPSSSSSMCSRTLIVDHIPSYPNILQFLFTSIEQTYCALIIHEESLLLRKKTAKGHNGATASVRSKHGTTDQPCALFCMTLVATSADHHEHLLRTPCSKSSSNSKSRGDELLRRPASQPINLVLHSQSTKKVAQSASKQPNCSSSKSPLQVNMSHSNSKNPSPTADSVKLPVTPSDGQSNKPAISHNYEHAKKAKNIVLRLMQSCFSSSCSGRQILVRIYQLEQCYLMFRSTQMSVWLNISRANTIPGNISQRIARFPNKTTDENKKVPLINDLRNDNGQHDVVRGSKLKHRLSTLYPGITMASSETYASVALDITLGFIVTMLFMVFFGPYNWFDIAMKHALSVVDTIQQLLLYLMDMPVGLKLNLSLNKALGSLSLYHFYLWKTFVTLIRPFLAIAIQILMLSGLLGLSCLLSVICDLLAVITIHIYCFYGYAARFHNLQINGLIALWRLFRGKKWNMLRHRVDSHHYGTDQLFVGTLTFTILIFLMPTILTYYLVFLALRAVTRGLQAAIRGLYESLTVMPVGTIILWLLGSQKIASQVCFVPLEPNYTCDESRILAHVDGDNGLLNQTDMRCRHNKGDEIYLTTCTESIGRLLALSSQLTHEHLKSWQATGNGIRSQAMAKPLPFALLGSNRVSLKTMLNKLLFGEIF